MAMQTPEKQILPIAPSVPDLDRLTKWAADITRILQDNLPRIARKANEVTAISPLTADLDAASFDITNLGGINFGSAVAPGGATDLSRHIALYSTTYGFSITSNTLNYVSGGTTHNWYIAGSLKMGLTGTGLTVLGTLTANTSVTVGGATNVSVLIGDSTLNTGAASIEIGNGRIGSGAALIDFHGQTGTDFDARIIRNSGANGTLDITNNGTGAIQVTGAVTFASAVTVSGTLTWNSTGSSTVRTTFTGTTGNSAMATATGSLGPLEAQGNGTGAAMMSFHRPGAFAAYLGIDTDNIWKVGGWSMGANAYKILHEALGAGTFTGNYTWSGTNNFTGTFQINGAALPFTKSFESSQQTITSAGALTLAHGLGVKPKLYLAFLQCTTADLNYSVGDEVPYFLSTGQAVNNQGVSMVPDATNLNVRFGSNVSVFSIPNKTTGVTANITITSWKFVARAWA